MKCGASTQLFSWITCPACLAGSHPAASAPPLIKLMDYERHEGSHPAPESSLSGVHSMDLSSEQLRNGWSNAVHRSAGIRAENNICGFTGDEIRMSSVDWGRSRTQEVDQNINSDEAKTTAIVCSCRSLERKLFETS